MKEINKFEFLDKIETREKNTFLFFFRKNGILHTEVWEVKNNHYFCNFDDFIYTKEQFLKCVNYLLNCEDLTIFEKN